MSPRFDERPANRLRPVRFELGVQRFPAGSCMVTFGDTRVMCAVSLEDGAPRWRQRRGWLTAEYAMLPGATAPRSRREGDAKRGRSQEIQRMIGRALRAVVEIDSLPDITVTVDCDVVHADGGTRTAAITGAWVALASAFERLGYAPLLRGQVASVSVGLVDGEPVLDMTYDEDVRASIDLNIVASADGRLVEIQGAAEAAPFERGVLDALIDLGLAGCQELFAVQGSALQSGGASA